MVSDLVSRTAALGRFGSAVFFLVFLAETSCSDQPCQVVQAVGCSLPSPRPGVSVGSWLPDGRRLETVCCGSLGKLRPKKLG